MAVVYDHEVVTDFDNWYKQRTVSPRTGCYQNIELAPCASATIRRYTDFKREMDSRVHGFEDLEKLTDAQVVTKHPDLPNVSSGETAGLVRRMARNLVQNVPNLEILTRFSSQSVKGILADFTLRSKIVQSDSYSNDMQQSLFASVKQALTVGFECVVPVLTQRGRGDWVVNYDTIHYRDVFPEPGARDVRQATEVFVRRYMTKGELMALIRNQTAGWDHTALKTVLDSYPRPPSYESQSVPQADKNRGVAPEGYPVITWYSSSGAPFLTFFEKNNLLLRIEKNKHPSKEHPVFFLILEKDNLHPLGKSQVELILGRQEFQDLMHNGAMKMWYQNINPPLIGYGTVNAIPNMSPGKFTSLSNPNSKIEAFEVNTQTLLQYQTIAQGNQGAMINTVGSADQQMAVQAGNGFSATPQGVEAQQQMVDITTNNYQKAIERFFSHYCSYALTMYFNELQGVKKLVPDAHTRQDLIDKGIPPEGFSDDGELQVNFSEMAIEYYVRCVPGSLVEIEEEKQLRILNQLFVPLSQSMPALAQANIPNVLQGAASALMFIVKREIELSGSNRSKELTGLLMNGETDEYSQYRERVEQTESTITGFSESMLEGQSLTQEVLGQLNGQIKSLSETQALILKHLGVGSTDNNPEVNTNAGQQPAAPQASV